MIELTKDFRESLEKIIEQKDDLKAQEILKELHPADIAELFQEINTQAGIYLYSLLDGEKAADTLMELDEEERNKLLKELPSELIAKRLVDNLETDDAVDLMRGLDENTQEEILSHIEDVEQAGDIVDLLKYDEDTAGGLMGTEMIVVNENWSMPQCIEEMRRQAEEIDEIYYVYVVDDDERLKGVLPLKRMITNPSVSKIKHVMKKEPIVVHDGDSIEEVALVIEKYDLVALPVVDSIGRLVGRITIDDVMDEVREQHERDYQLASGISQDVESSDNVIQQTAARLPWLVIGMIGGLGNSILLGGFESGFATNPKMALFIPLIGGTGGNVGIQSSAIVVQGLANNTLKASNILSQVLKESVVALINASMISLIVFIYNYFTLGDRAITASVSLSLFAVVMFASIFGTLVPMTLNKLKIDPALATGPFITITNDIIGMMIYMYITSMLL
ncbi:magnesium transporter [Parabacteroides sp. PF5-5]|uniref:magnesium transporter n=1 Tax=unclassified Parabacteroides TaxID=2649774 RepID=UPI00247693C4|nr:MULTISPECIES: magnesium transporter [unclassified Parabacteroides]MDH6303523.1 magnesium transporter [Parabacteroides sp. PH5-39]MDH6314845.1 magnesium transporter [Parabacteroides sp. PF5-13]MDH6318182.1 magnesium transporter [Parabacteroides sp. PH5-13]MDH6321886.1 magnesium transporter [Parabacteroides sp. PH5-8]MDH6326010.1 magnesium transporter [Parabacteroides sp. PH5-41]